MRVGSIQRADNGNLYIAGTGESSIRIVYLDSSDALQSTTLNQKPVHNRGKPIKLVLDWMGMVVVFESLTGSTYTGQVSVMPSVDMAGGMTPSGSGAQILDMEIPITLFAVGSTINQPYFFYESNMTDTFSMETIKLSGGSIAAFEGEVWDIGIDNLEI